MVSMDRASGEELKRNENVIVIPPIEQFSLL